MDRGYGHAQLTQRSKIVPRFAVEIAEVMIRIPAGRVVAIFSGTDCEGKRFVSFTPPLVNPNEASAREYEMWWAEMRREVLEEFAGKIGKGKEVLNLQVAYDNFLGLIRYPREIVESFPEERVTLENYRSIVTRTAMALREEPDRWVTEG